MGNRICLGVYAVVLWRFFNGRIESTLLFFFSTSYPSVGVPGTFLRGFSLHIPFVPIKSGFMRYNRICLFGCFYKIHRLAQAEGGM